ncbi:MAG: acetylglutamate kinase [Acidobacteria bacterium]|nr:acetylglutamate kinase [Acidobacteriota bacterium]
MTIVVKIGGQAIEDHTQRRAVARQIVALRRAGHHVVVVHGGGKLLTATLQKLGIPTHFHDGLRVTDAATRDVALMVLGGIVNKQWVAELESQGQRALGISGGDAGLVLARKLQARRNGARHDLGFVGRPQKISTHVLDVAFRAGMVPVVASLALGPGGQYYNINADDLAAALAAGLEADRLLYLTESGGVWDAEKNILPVVRLGEIARLIRREIVRDGMIPKLRSCARTLRRNVHEIDILSPAVPDGLLKAVSSRAAVGTRIVK